jgi:hypothetical protein
MIVEFVALTTCHLPRREAKMNYDNTNAIQILPGTSKPKNRGIIDGLAIAITTYIFMGAVVILLLIFRRR